MTAKHLAALRREYRRGQLDENSIAADPFEQFEQWLTQAIATELPESNAMVLATATPDGIPSVRVVLLKGIEDGGFCFYTHLHSRKGREIATNPHVELLFFWAELERQVRIEGIAYELDPATVRSYFTTRPRLAQLSAWASPQSSTIASRAELEQSLQHYEELYANCEDIPVPPWWGGYRVVPSVFEFWQGRENRLHDRFRYERTTTGWRLERLAP